MDFEEGVHYRMAYGLAHQLADARRFDMQRGRYRTNRAATSTSS